MDGQIHESVLRLFAAIEAKNLDATVACFAPNARVIDPHYPIPDMRGQNAIREGLCWAFGTLDRMRFAPLHVCTSVDGRVQAIETRTHHTVRGDQHLRFTQTFVIDIDNDVITRLQAYTPYGPPGVGGALLMLVRVQRKLAALLRRSAR